MFCGWEELGECSYSEFINGVSATLYITSVPYEWIPSDEKCLYVYVHVQSSLLHLYF